MSYRTLRDKNYCLSCDYEWYPRGKHRSSKCPNCGNRDVRMRQYYIVYDTPVRKRMRLVMLITCLGMWFGVTTKSELGGIVGTSSLFLFAASAISHTVHQHTETRYE